ncbi:hypothetical protein ACVPOY_07480 [Staphylococcus aureus]
MDYVTRKLLSEYNQVNIAKTNLKKPRVIEQSLIKNLKPGNRIYPGVYNRRFNISIKEIVLIMNAFIDKDIINLRFQIQIDGDLKPEDATT